jgi:7,8-dihydroneopterin aldolase/epimerase/oxygenase
LDKIFIKNLIVPVIVGITEKERSTKQLIIVDIYLYRDLKDAGTSDDPKRTLSYSKIRDSVIDFVSSNKFKLVEGVAEGIASLLLKNKAVEKVKVRVRKEKYADHPSIGVEIVRARNE